jgi:hypothetical protein
MSNWKTYTMESGHHSSEPVRARLHAGFFPRSWSWDVMFDDSAEYDFDSVDQLDINKLVGVSVWSHLANSFRFGWRWSAAKAAVEVLPFVTIRGVDNRLTSAPLATVRPGEVLNLRVEICRSSATLSASAVDRQPVVATIAGQHGPRNQGLAVFVYPRKWGPLVGYHLHPYFGGNRTAPHDVRLRIKQL